MSTKNIPERPFYKDKPRPQFKTEVLADRSDLRKEKFLDKGNKAAIKINPFSIPSVTGERAQIPPLPLIPASAWTKQLELKHNLASICQVRESKANHIWRLWKSESARRRSYCRIVIGSIWYLELVKFTRSHFTRTISQLCNLQLWFWSTFQNHQFAK